MMVRLYSDAHARRAALDYRCCGSAQGMTRPLARWQVVWFGFALACGAASAYAQCARGPEYRQADAVRHRYPDPGIAFATPAFIDQVERLKTAAPSSSARWMGIVVRSVGACGTGPQPHLHAWSQAHDRFGFEFGQVR